MDNNIKKKIELTYEMAKELTEKISSMQHNHMVDEIDIGKILILVENTSSIITTFKDILDEDILKIVSSTLAELIVSYEVRDYVLCKDVLKYKLNIFLEDLNIAAKES